MSDGEIYRALVRTMRPPKKTMKVMPLKWFMFTGLPITRWGRGTEDQAQEYAEMKARRYPDANCVEVDGEPDNRAATIISLEVMLGVESDG